MTHCLVVTARAQLGKPFRHRGRGPGSFDCVGMVAWALTHHGFPIKDVRYYGRAARPQDLRAAIEANLGKPITGAWQPGDIAIVALPSQPNHLALIADYLHGGLSLIHCYGAPGIKRVVEHGINAEWRQQIDSVYRVEGLR